MTWLKLERTLSAASAGGRFPFHKYFNITLFLQLKEDRCILAIPEMNCPWVILSSRTTRFAIAAERSSVVPQRLLAVAAVGVRMPWRCSALRKEFRTQGASQNGKLTAWSEGSFSGNVVNICSTMWSTASEPGRLGSQACLDKENSLQ